jgi:hypothetical protein
MTFYNPTKMSNRSGWKIPWLSWVWFGAIALLLVGVIWFTLALTSNDHSGRIAGLALLIPFAAFAFVLSLISMIQLLKSEMDAHVLGRDPFRESECQSRKANPGLALIAFTAEFKELYQKEGVPGFERAYERRIRQFHRHGIKPRVDRNGLDRTLYVPDVILYAKENTAEAIGEALAELCGIIAGTECLRLLVIVPEVKNTQEDRWPPISNLLTRAKAFVEAISEFVQAGSGQGTGLIVEVPDRLIPKVAALGFKHIPFDDDASSTRARLAASVQ